MYRDRIVGGFSGQHRWFHLNQVRRKKEDQTEEVAGELVRSDHSSGGSTS